MNRLRQAAEVDLRFLINDGQSYNKSYSDDGR